MSQQKVKLKGIFAALVCSFDEKGQVDEEAIRDNVRYCLDGGCAGVVANGSTGEAVALSREERIKVIKICVDECHSRGKKVIAGTGAATTEATLMYTRDAKEAGADAVLVITPFNCIPTQEGLRIHYESVADVGIPVVLYNIPTHTNVTIEMDTFDALVKHPNVIGIKDSSGNLGMLAEIYRKYGTEVSVFTGSDDLILQIFSAGADAAVLCLANIAPKNVNAVLDAINNNDLETARKEYFKILPIATAIGNDENFPACVKEAVEQLGHKCGPCRLPCTPCTEEDKKKVHDALVYAGLL